MPTRYEDCINTRLARYKDMFSDIALAKKFVPFFNSGERVVVQFQSGEIKRGTIGITTGWIPSFLLMLRITDKSSSYLLTDKDEILGVVKGKR